MLFEREMLQVELLFEMCRMNTFLAVYVEMVVLDARLVGLR
jgi:hypothetical protein